MKIAFKIFLLLAVVGYLVFAVWKFADKAEDRTCEGVNVEIMDSIADGFITEEYICSVLTKNKIYPEGMKISTTASPFAKASRIWFKTPFKRSGSTVCVP